MGAQKLGVGLRQFQPERRRLGVDAMRTADDRRVFVFERASLDRREQRLDIGDQNVARALQLHGEAGVEHVRTGHALMHEAQVGADEFRKVGQEGDDVVLGDALDLVDALDVESHMPRFLPDRPGAFLRNDADLGQRVASVGLDLEPDPEPRLRLPDANHFGA